jgi:hypothetical protein
MRNRLFAKYEMLVIGMEDNLGLKNVWLNPRREVLATLLETDLEDPMVEKVYEKARLVPTCSTFRNIFCSKFPIRFTGLVYS